MQFHFLETTRHFHRKIAIVVMIDNLNPLFDVNIFQCRTFALKFVLSLLYTVQFEDWNRCNLR